MKKALLLVALLGSIGVAQASELMYLTNKAGGLIVFNTEQCSRFSDAREMYTRSPNGKTDSGCWHYTEGDSYVKVIYNDNSAYTYPVKDLVFASDLKK